MKYDRFAEAEALLQEILETKRAVLGANNPEVCPLYDKLARVATRQAQFDKALQFYDMSLALKQQLRMDGENIARSKNGKAQLLFAQRKLSEAKVILDEVVSQFRDSKKGKTSSELGIALDNLGQLHAATFDHDRAKELFEYAPYAHCNVFVCLHLFVQRSA
jgi:tetratricopeptide (TPR) repeat protein